MHTQLQQLRFNHPEFKTYEKKARNLITHLSIKPSVPQPIQNCVFVPRYLPLVKNIRKAVANIPAATASLLFAIDALPDELCADDPAGELAPCA